MWPFGQTVLAWRLARGLTQEALARTARISRPNLSAIERGRREVTLGTLRSLALALGTRPGVLADGIPPGDAAAPLSRADLERVARVTAKDERLPDARLADLARRLREVAAARLEMAGGRTGGRRTSRRAARAWLLLKAGEAPATLSSLLERVAGQLEQR